MKGVFYIKIRKYVTIIFLATALPFSTWVFPCSMMCPDLKSDIERSKNIFTGKVISIKEYGINWFTDEPKIRVEFEVLKNWKGSWGSQVLRTTRHNGYSCTGSSFQESQNYIVLIGDENVVLCNTVPFNKALSQKIDDILKGDTFRKPVSSNINRK